MVAVDILVAAAVAGHMEVVVEVDIVEMPVVEVELQARFVLYGLAIHVASRQPTLARRNYFINLAINNNFSK
jgi:hypothetical protein